MSGASKITSGVFVGCSIVDASDCFAFASRDSFAGAIIGVVVFCDDSLLTVDDALLVATCAFDSKITAVGATNRLPASVVCASNVSMTTVVANCVAVFLKVRGGGGLFMGGNGRGGREGRGR